MLQIFDIASELHLNKTIPWTRSALELRVIRKDAAALIPGPVP
jgi:hypothetical protein